ncbi:MAG: hypothetical protein COW30_10385 [Rhodospirillales bacterium CG15_BIG_FIL_POST_REV_8_21_14_020_66_15]|nr:MAG: hypothetical protein COW30_10385 [Rhodospirillales bacterium CG15_BIG_FIL_POST_REV_8_21_14_020_66_15]
MKNTPLTPVTEKSAWTAAELADDPGWTRILGSKEIAALERATAERDFRGKGALQFEREDFDEPALAALADWAVEELENGRGCVLIKGLEVDRYDRPRIEAMYWALAVLLGIPMHHNPDGDIIGEVTDQGLDYNDPLIRGYKTRQKLFFHCDGLDIVSLLCLQPSMSGGESQIASSTAVYNEILATHPEYLQPLFEGFRFNLRGEGEAGETHPVTRHKVPVYSWCDGRLSCRYLRKAIIEGQNFIGEPISDLARAALDYMQDLCASDKFRYDMPFEPGDIQILNNYVTLHSRAAFEDWPDGTRKRNLLRIWMNLRNGRKLEPRFADRYNTGPRTPMRLKGDRAA